LIRQAEQLVGRSFADAMRILVPGFFDQAVIAIGGAQVFDLPVERLASLVPEGEAAAQQSSEDSSWGSASEEPQQAAPADDGWGSSDDSAAETSEAEPAQDVVHASEPKPAPPSRPTAATRQQAFTLLDQVAGYYRVAEPTSPVPLIIERARRLAERDFMFLLREVLPASTLRSLNSEGQPQQW
jgi:type VI secretion system protein ImpA